MDLSCVVYPVKLIAESFFMDIDSGLRLHIENKCFVI